MTAEQMVECRGLHGERIAVTDVELNKAWWLSMPARLRARRDADRARGYPVGSPERRMLEES